MAFCHICIVPGGTVPGAQAHWLLDHTGGQSYCHVRGGGRQCPASRRRRKSRLPIRGKAMVPECYESFYRRSLADREGFWAEQAELIDWHRRWDQVLDYSRPPFARWFAGGQTNLCHNAVDRHLDGRAEQPALTWISTETGGTASFSYRELHREVVCFAAVLRELGIGQGDRVIIYMPMIPEAAFAMLACARLGAIHSVVFGGFAGANLAKRIDDARPKLLITSDAGMRGGKVIPYKHLVDEAIRLSASPPKRVLICRRGLEPKMPIVEGRDLDYAGLRRRHLDADVPVVWLESNEP